MTDQPIPPADEQVLERLEPTARLLAEACAHYEDAIDMMFDGPDESDEGYAKARWNDARAKVREALAMRPAPETTASYDVVERIAGFVERWSGDSRDGDTQFIADEIRETFANLPKPTEQATSPAPDAVLRDEAFCAAVWDALKADTNDLRKQQRILNAFRAALASPASTAEEKGHGYP